MWENIKNDPLLKTIIVAILGVLAFGFAFNIMFGSGNSRMEDDSMMGNGYSLSNTLEVTIGILIKLVLIAILVGIILWIIQAIRKQIGGKAEYKNSILLEDGVIRNALLFAGFVVVFVFLLWFGKNTLFYGYGKNMMSQSFYPAFSIISIVIFLIKLLILALVGSLGFGIFMYFRETITKKSNHLDETFEPNKSTSKTCSTCQSTMNREWTYCPNCGNSTLENENNSSSKEEQG